MSTSQHSSQELVATLASNDAAERIKARETLAELGASAVPDLLQALGDPEQHVRWEAAKTLAAIGDPSAAEKLSETLGDEESDVRWVAGEALIALGHAGLKPLLTRLTKSRDSAGLYKAAHHVLHDLAQNAKLAPVVKPVLTALGRSDPELAVPVAAERALASMCPSHITRES
jgi:HEAT repeat protein